MATGYGIELTSLHANEAGPHIEHGRIEQSRRETSDNQDRIAPCRRDLFLQICFPAIILLPRSRISLSLAHLD
jgi:hypothetical protein